MWKLNEITAENICSFSNLHYVLSQGVATLVFGNNLDNENQGSNGSGKSATVAGTMRVSAEPVSRAARCVR